MEMKCAWGLSRKGSEIGECMEGLVGLLEKKKCLVWKNDIQ